MSKSYNLKGFTLLEVAIVLAIVGLLLAGGVNLLSGSADTSKYKQTQNELQEVKEALITYFIQN
ncbi:MAG: prepilin-type N-terminal cleavage/methylation domain-containing protein, partial [Gammaproteobacteria bacterium]|nr:prepilin-type N-terminal cleavage/methylation domain-containing protein [Gammaproteobacteria bacterium]